MNRWRIAALILLLTALVMLGVIGLWIFTDLSDNLDNIILWTKIAAAPFFGGNICLLIGALLELKKQKKG